MLSEIVQCIIVVAAIVLGTMWAWKKRRAPLARIEAGLSLATTVFLVLCVVSLRTEHDLVEVAVIIVAWQLVPWCWIVVWRRYVDKEGQAVAKD